MTATSPDPYRTGPHGAPPPGCPAHREGPGGAQRLYGRAAAADPAALYEGLRARHGAVAPVLLEGDVPAWLVLGYDEILHVTRSPRRFSRDGRNWSRWIEGRIGPDAPIAPVLLWGPDCAHQDGAAHQRLRGAVHESLRRFDRRGLRRLAQHNAHGLIDRFAADGRADLVAQYARQLPVLTLTQLLGLPEPEGPRLAEASRQLLLGTERAVTSDRYLKRALCGLVERKHAAPGHDLASWLIAHPAGLSEEEVGHHLRLVLVAANEATTNLIVNTLRVFVHPAFRGPLLGGRMTPHAAVEQVLWDEPPIAVCPGGFALQDVELGGRHIRRGDLLLLGLAAANADPEIRPAPGAPMHGNRSHLAFTSGPHECPGQEIGRAICVTAVEVLLARLPGLRPAAGPEELTWSASTWSRHLDALPVAFTPRRPAAAEPERAGGPPPRPVRQPAWGQAAGPAAPGAGSAAGPVAAGGRVGRRAPAVRAVLARLRGR
ncbi:cytochrome P450 family protein [Streptomyces johnsoniae]|uniref:Cytochrome P450 n=1 Tax=Streptomyces johnsoniae TaxID=3075532 RepID=A0ABU2S673_9ACTN|nr:cytochrome P450 [Streptomyces sp. DSM 41886]MDT0444181.1 cytochrome P450 [Streptomyces sp. DSM 41886]